VNYVDQLDKEPLYFTQCNDTFPNRCPECTSTKILRHCKIYHNFPAVWKHIKQDHKDILESRLDEISHVENCLFKAYKWNMFPKWEFSEAKIEPTTTSSSILFDGKPARIDVLEKLQEIARVYKRSSDCHKLNQKQVTNWANAVLKHPDLRTLEKYVKCVTSNSKPDKIKGEYDVTQFCNKVGV